MEVYSHALALRMCCNNACGKMLATALQKKTPKKRHLTLETDSWCNTARHKCTTCPKSFFAPLYATKTRQLFWALSWLWWCVCVPAASGRQCEAGKTIRPGGGEVGGGQINRNINSPFIISHLASLHRCCSICWCHFSGSYQSFVFLSFFLMARKAQN